MTWRMKIADWISGGELTRTVELEIFDARCIIEKHRMESIARGAALREIAHMRTPRCASIGNRMADIAEDALR